MDRVRAKIFLVAIFFIWLGLLYPIKEVVLFLALAAIASKSGKVWNKNFWMISDYAVAFVFGAFHKTTVSSEIGKMAEQAEARIIITGNKERSIFFVERVVNKIFEAAADQKNHCRASIETEDLHTVTPTTATIGVSLYVAFYYYYMFLI
jgi:hypothetical protein